MKSLHPGPAIRHGLSLLMILGLLEGCVALHVNATTASLLSVLLVLAVSTYWRIEQAVLVSVIAMLGVNYLFLPPIGTLTISEPQNWIALIAFLTTAFTVSQLSSRAVRRADELLQRTKEVESLYELSRAMLLDDSGDSEKNSITRAASIFGLDQVKFYELASERSTESAAGNNISNVVMAQVAQDGEPFQTSGVSVVPVRFGTRLIGSLGLSGGELTPAIRDSIASLLAINYERLKALDRALAADAERRSEAFRSSLLDGLAHDLKTPLTSIRTCVTCLVDMPPKSEEARREMLEIIDQESLRLQRSISEAIELARVESSKLNLERSEVDVAELILSALLEARDEDNSRYLIKVPQGLTLRADRKLLRQALKQILENAWKYTPPGSPVEIEAIAAADVVEISIADHGPGIANSELERIFQKFYRGQRYKGLAEGTGMGLAVSKGIIEAHGGRIRAENLPRGGSRFIVTLPNQSS